VFTSHHERPGRRAAATSHVELNMKLRTAALGAVLALATAVTSGCGAQGLGKALSGEPASPPPLTAEEKLLKAVPGQDRDIYHYKLKGGEIPMEGVLDVPAKSARLDMTQKIKNSEVEFTMVMKLLIVQDRTWMRMSFRDAGDVVGLPKLPDKWMLLDPAKLKGDIRQNLSFDDMDPGQFAVVVDGIVAAKEGPAGTFTGTTDLAKHPEAELLPKATLSALGAKAKAVPFEATVDGEGRLSHALIKVPAAGKVKAETYEITYDRYGTAAKVSVPAAGEQQKAPATAYELLNS
jgi:hypothetical protein